MNKEQFIRESAGEIMTDRVPTCTCDDTFLSILGIITKNNWRTIDNVFVLNADRKILGVVRLASLSHSDPEVKAQELMEKVRYTANKDEDRETLMIESIKNDADIVPVVDKDGTFLGAVVAKTIIDTMHEEHLEDTIRASGINIDHKSMLKLATAGIFEVIKARLPWIIVGIVAGLCLGLISSIFEGALNQYVALAYFVPVVAYIADSIGTQAEAITVRALATSKISYYLYLLREGLSGAILGAFVGLIGGIGALFIAKSTQIAFVVGISLFAASAIASVLASAIPMLFKSFGKDPALGSGPLSTAIQDILSVFIYFIIAVSILHIK